ncbi:MAG TPA: DUF5010 domain-containing protein [Candidatus Binatia bacterium]|jgi:autotransporter-associated beta strand protein|nr:DUF5010 domain-containing protein [Candidatus Binatia bacterium]
MWSQTSISRRNDSGLKHCLGRLSAPVLSSFALCLNCYAGSWYVGNTAPGEWIQYQQVWLANGHYRFTARAGATNSGAALHVEIDGTAVKPGVIIPNTGRMDVFTNVHCGSTNVSQGYHDLKVVFESSGLSLDWFMLAKDTDTTNGVKLTDITMVRPPTNGMLIAPIIGFEHHEATSYPASSAQQLGIPDIPDINGHQFSEYQLTNWYGVPMYRDFDRRSDRYWDVLVEQLLASRAQVPFLHCRETADFNNSLQTRAYAPGGGWYEGRWLEKFSEAVARNPQAVSSLKMGMFWESGGIALGFYNHYGYYPGWGTSNFVDYVMQDWIQPWFDNIPRELLFQPVTNRPVISFFASNPDNIVRDGQMSTFMAQFRSEMVARYGMDPLIIMPVGGGVDPATEAQGWGQANWVTWDGPLCTSNYLNGTYWCTASSGSRRRLDTVWLNDWNPVSNTGTPNTNDANGHDSHQPRLDSNGNSMMWSALNQAYSVGSQFVQEEGFYNISEGNSIFRSYHPEWVYPNQHLAAMRDFADTNTATLMFEAEACDSYYKTITNDNTGGTYRKEWYRPTTLDVYRPLHNALPWKQMNAGSATLVKISAGFFDAWALDSSGRVWAQTIMGDVNSWQQVSTPQNFTCVSVGKCYAWGIAGTTVYSAQIPNNGWTSWSTGGWSQRSGSMTQLSVGATEVWAVNSSAQVFRRPVDGSGDWTQVSGTMTQISVGDAFVWAMNGGNIYYSLTSLASPSWTQCPNPNNIINVQVGSDEVWGVTASGSVYRMSASGAGTWDLVDGNRNSVSVGDGYVWGLSGSTPYCRRLEGFALSGVPMTPFTPKATPATGQVKLLWTLCSGATNYNIKRATASGGPYTTIANVSSVSYIYPYVDSTAANGTTYYYVVSALNGSGESTNSPEVSATPQSQVPAAPSNLTVPSFVSGQLQIAWTDTSGNESGFKIERKVGVGGTYVQIAVVPAGVTSFTDTVLAGSDYYYRVRAYNAAGNSGYSNEAMLSTASTQLSRSGWVASSSTSGSDVPANALDGNPSTRWSTDRSQAPGQWFQVDMRANYTVFQVNLDATASPNDYPRGYQVNLSTDGNNWGSPVAVGNGGGAVTAIQFPAHSARYIRVTQTGSAGNYWSIHEFYAFGLSAPTTPTGLAALAGYAQVTLSWSTSLNATSYNVNRSTTSGGPYSVIASGVTSTGYTNTGLANGTTYYYVVSATNALGQSGNSAEVSATPNPVPVPNVPTGLTALAGAGQVALSWSASSNAASYNVKRSTTSGGPYSLAATNVTGLAYTDTGLVSGTQYYYVVSAVNGSGESANSSEVNATPSNDVYWLGAVDANWTTSGNWSNAPVTGQRVVYDATSVSNFAQTLGQNWSINGIRVGSPGGDIVLSGGNTLSNAGGIDMSAATRNLSLNTPQVLTADQTWFVGTGGALTNASAGTVANGGYSFSISNSGNVYVYGSISGNGPVIKNGSGTVTWGSQGSYTGGTMISGGTVAHLSGVNGLGLAWSPVAVTSGGTWSLNGISASATTVSLTNGNCGVNKSGNLNFFNLASSGISSIGVSELKIGQDAAGGIYTVNFNVVDGTLTLNVNRLYNYTSTATGSVVKVGSGTLLVSSMGTSYKGSTTIQGGVIQVGTLANGGTDSHIGQSSNAAANLVLNGGSLRYVGAAVGIDRLFSVGSAGGTLDASGSGALTLNNTGAMGFADSGSHSVTLTGSSTAANTLAAAIGNNGGPTTLLKSGTGSWSLSGASSFSGGTVVPGGTLTVGAGATLGSGNLSVSNGAVCVLQNAGALSSGAYVYLNGTLNLAYSGTNTVSRLYVGGVLQPAGVWNAVRDGHFAGAGSLNVTAGSATGPIVLQVSGLSGGGLQLSWTNSAVDLYYTPSLTPPVVWSLVTNQASFSNGQWTLTLPTGTNGNGFYRLRQ